MRPIQTFQVGLKAFVWHARRLLVVQESDAAARWELPGGRIDAGEQDAPLASVLRRELDEELGPAFRCVIGAPVVCWVRPPEPHRTLPVFLTGFACSDPVGEIVLSHEHRAHRWITADERAGIAFAPGYAAAVERFLAAAGSLCG